MAATAPLVRSYAELERNQDGVVDRSEASLAGIRRPRRLVSRGKCTSEQKAGYFTVDFTVGFWQVLLADRERLLVPVHC